MDNYKERVAITLKKANSLTAKIIKMIEADQYCIDIIQQNLAVIGLLKSANLALLEGHLNVCFKNAVREKNQTKLNTMIEELIKVMKTAQNK